MITSPAAFFRRHHVHGTRPLDPHTVAQYPATPTRPPRSRTRLGSSSLAECFLCPAGAVLLSRCPCRGLSILSEVTPPTGEPDAGRSARPVRREGERSRSPYPYRDSLIWQEENNPSPRLRRTLSPRRGPL